MVALGAQGGGDPRKLDAEGEKWVAATLKKMSLDDKVGQLLVSSFGSEYLSTDSPEYDARHAFAEAWDDTKFKDAFAIWNRSRFAPLNRRELGEIAFVLADSGDELAARAAESLRAWNDTEAEAVLAELRVRQGRTADAVPHVLQAFKGYQSDPWPDSTTMGRLFDVAIFVARSNPTVATQVYEVLERPFAAMQWDDARKYTRVWVGSSIAPCGPAMLHALADLEPYPHWRENVLRARAQCYSRRGLAELASDANRDWKEFQSMSPVPLVH